MSSEITCNDCGTVNPPGSNFCNGCGARLAVPKNVICPSCQTPNAPALLYCDRCGTRLSAEAPEAPQDTPAPKKGSAPLEPFSLPTRQPGDTGDLDINNLPEWLRTGVKRAADVEKPQTAGFEFENGADDTDSWLAELEALSGDDESVVDGDFAWLAPETGALLPADEPPAAAPDSEPDDDWLHDDTPGLDSSPQRLADGDVPDWLTDQAGQFRDPTEAPEQDDNDFARSVDLPAWLADATAGLVEPLPDDETGGQLSATGLLGNVRPAEQADAEPAEQPLVNPDLSGFTSWLEEIQETAPEPPLPPIELVDAMEEEPADEADTAPAANVDDELTAPALAPPVEASPVVPPADLPDWLRDMGTIDEPPASDTEQLLSQEAIDQASLPGWLTGMLSSEPTNAPDRPVVSAANNAADDSAAAPSDALEAGFPDRDSAQQDEPDWAAEVDDRAVQPSDDLDIFIDPDTLAGAPEAPPAEPPTASVEVDLDWLTDLGEEEPAAGSGGETVAGIIQSLDADGYADDWLDALEPSGADGLVDDAPLPDNWLDAMEAETPSAMADASADAGEDDWLTALDPLSAAPDADDPAPPADQEAEDIRAASVPAAPVESDWLAQLDAPAENTLDVPESSLPDNPAEEWLAELDAADESEGDAPVSLPAAAIATDWLSELDAADESEGDAPVSLPAAAIATDWLSELDAADESDAAVADDVPDSLPAAAIATDWLAELNADAGDADLAAGAAADLPAADPAADWLAELDDSDETEPDAVADVDAAADAPEDLPAADPAADWLAELDFLDDQPADAGDADLAAGAVDDLPAADPAADWLAELDDSDETEPDAVADVDAAADAPEDLLAAAPAADWLAELDMLRDKALDAPDDLLAAAPAESWLPDLDDDEGAELEAPAAEDALKTGADSDEFGWLRAIAAEESELILDELDVAEPGLADEKAQVGSAERTSAPDWLAGIADLNDGDLPPEMGEVSYDEMPEWLQAPDDADFSGALEAALAVQDGETPDSGEETLTDLLSTLSDDAPPQAEGALAEADIPDWVMALRPDPHARADAPPAEQEEEAIGPLAGMRGVIDIEPIIALPLEPDVDRPVVVTAAQAAQVKLLSELARAEQNNLARVDQQSRRALPTWVRWLVAVLLLAAVISGLYVDLGAVLPLSTLPEPTGSSRAAATVGGVANQAVLVAFEYSPAMAGELAPQAELLLQQLADAGNTVYTVSQAPLGVAMAREAADVAPDAVRHLGLVPGGAAGLRALADCLPELTDCTTLYGRTLTADAGPIALLVVVGSERETLLGWIEQVGARQPDLPLVAAVTSSAGPLMQPYLESGQLDGLLDGLGTANTYARVQDLEGTRLPTIFEGQQLAVWLAALLLLLGNLGALIVRPPQPPQTHHHQNGTAAETTTADAAEETANE